MKKSTDVSRRAVVSIAAAEFAMPAFVRPARAAQSTNPDAELFARFQEWETVVARCEAADRMRSAAGERYDSIRLDEPEALLWRDKDGAIFSSFTADTGPFRGERRQGFFHEHTISNLRTLLHLLEEKTDAKATQIIAAKIARCREILDASDTWKAETQMRWRAAGMEEAERASQEAERLCGEIRQKIIATRAFSIEGVLLKVRVAESCFGESRAEAEEYLREEMSEDWSGESMSLSIVLDLMNLQPASVAASEMPRVPAG